MTESIKKVMSIITCIAIMFTMLPTLGLTEEAHATSGPSIVFVHAGEYEIDFKDRANPPAAVEGDYLDIDGEKYMYSSPNPMSMFLKGNSPDPYEYFEALWVDEPNTFEPGNTYYFRYYLEDYNMDPYYSSPIAVKIKAETKTPTAISFTHNEAYMLTPDEAVNVPEPVAGDKITASYEGEDNEDFTYGEVNNKKGFFNKDNKTIEQVTGLTLSAEWNENQTFEPGDEPSFVCKLGNLKSNDIQTKIVNPVELELTLSSERTVDRALAKALGKLAIPAEKENDTLNVILKGEDNIYTHDGMEFVKNGFPLYNLVGNNEGHEWAEDEDFTGETAKYHYYIIKDGQKYVSNDVEVELTGELPVETKEITALEFTPVSEYAIPVSEAENPPAPADGDVMKVTYDDESEENFTFDEAGEQGADFYNEDGLSLSQVAKYDWEYEWLGDQTFIEGETVYFKYYLGETVSNSIPVLLTAEPVEPVPTAIAFTHDGDYTLEVNTGNKVPVPVDGDIITVTYDDELTEDFIYSSEDGVFVSNTTSMDIESLGLELGCAWNDDQQFIEGNTVYFRWMLGELETDDIPVLVVDSEKAAREAIEKAKEALENAEGEDDKTDEAIEVADDAKKEADKAAKNETLKEARKASDKAAEAAENALDQAKKSKDAADKAKKAAEDALDKAKVSKDPELIEEAQDLLDKANKAVEEADKDLEKAQKDYEDAIALKDKLAKKNDLLNLKMKKAGKKKITLKWNKINGAKKYVVYGAKCKGTNKVKKIKSVKKNTLSIRELKGKKLKANKFYKFRVVAKDKNGKTISKSIIIHVKTKGGKRGNYKAVVVKKGKKAISKLSLKEGKSVKLTGKQIKGRKPVSKHQDVIFKSSNRSIATVTAKGLVKGKGKGKCIINAYAQNGVYKTIEVTIK